MAEKYENLLDIIKNRIKFAVRNDEDSIYFIIKGMVDDYNELVKFIQSQNTGNYYISCIGSVIYDGDGSFEPVVHLTIKWDSHNINSWIYK